MSATSRKAIFSATPLPAAIVALDQAKVDAALGR
jgi:hypothetical protein